MYLFAVRDRVSERFNSPFVSANLADAKRAFQCACSQEQYASDYELWQLGSYDLCKGEIVPAISKVCDFPVQDLVDIAEAK